MEQPVVSTKPHGKSHSIVEAFHRDAFYKDAAKEYTIVDGFFLRAEKVKRNKGKKCVDLHIGNVSDLNYSVKVSCVIGERDYAKLPFETDEDFLKFTYGLITLVRKFVMKGERPEDDECK